MDTVKFFVILMIASDIFLSINGEPEIINGIETISEYVKQFITENMAHNSTIPLPDEGPDGGLLYSIKENTPLSRKYPQPYTESEDPLCSLSLESKRNLCFRSAQWFYNDMSLIRSDNTQLSCRLKVVQVESGSGILSLPIRALDCHVTIAYENDINHREIINFIVSAGPNRNSIFIHAIIERKIVPHVFIKNIQFNEF